MGENGHVKEVPAWLAQTRARAAKVAEEVPGVTLGQAIVEMAEGPREGVSIADRLVRKFGLGEEPRKRRELYRRLQRLIELKGDRVYDIVSGCVADAVGAKRADRWFAAAVVRRLREAGYALGADPGGDPSW